MSSRERRVRNPDTVSDGTEQDQIAASVAAGEATAKRDIEHPPIEQSDALAMSSSEMDEYFDACRIKCLREFPIVLKNSLRKG